MSDRDQVKPESGEELTEFIESHQEILDLLDRVWRADRTKENLIQNSPPGESEIKTPQFANEKTKPFRRQTFASPAAFNHAQVQHDHRKSTSLVQSQSHRFDPELPRKIGRFEIVSLLGQGGYGLVYLARDPRLRRDVALKIPRPEVVMTDELRLRFLRESELAAALSHAQIVPVFEAGNFGPICYIASAFCDGPTLGQWVQQQDVPIHPLVAARLAIGLAEAIQHAHLRHVIHRDLKPSNILVERSNQPIEIALSGGISSISPSISPSIVQGNCSEIPKDYGFRFSKTT